MTGSPHIDVATSADLTALTALRAEQGWQPNARLLSALLAWEGARLFVIRGDASGAVGSQNIPAGPPIASTAAIVAGAVGVIGNVVVRDDYQRRGLGRALMAHALAWQRRQGARAVLLDATVAGRPLYRHLGFFATEDQSWFAHMPISALEASVARGGSLRTSLAKPSTLPRVAALDVAAFGGGRLGLLALMLRQPDAWLYVAEDAAGEPAGYLLARVTEPPRMGLRVGPWVAKTDAVASALLAALLATDAPWRGHISSTSARPADLFLSLPGSARGSLALLSDLGARIEPDDLIMQLDFERQADMDTGAPAAAPLPVAAHPEWVYAWLAPMVF